VTHEEFLAVVEKCRDHRGALTVFREAGRLLGKKPPLAFAQLEKFLQEWSAPVTIDRGVRLAIQVLEHEDGNETAVAQAKELLSALLLATGERAAEYERQARPGGAKSRA
jgi:hypothetical protein